MKRVTVNLSDDLHEAAEILRRRGNYRSMSEMFVALLRWQAQTQRVHGLAAHWATLTGHERDRVDAELSSKVKSGTP